MDGPRTTTPYAPDQRYQPSADVVFRSVGEDVVMLDLERGSYFSLNETGGQVWMRLCAGETPREVAVAIAEEYDATPDAVARDVEDTVVRLLDAGLLAPADA